MTMDDGGALGSWTCQPHVPNQRFAFDRYMGRYCVTSRPNICVMEAILRHAATLAPSWRRQGRCLEFDGSLQSLQEKGCNASEPQQQWSYDAATLVFRHAANSRVCIDYFVQHNTFGAWTCRDELEVNARQSFRYDEGRDRFCLLSDPRRCVHGRRRAICCIERWRWGARRASDKKWMPLSVLIPKTTTIAPFRALQ